MAHITANLTIRVTPSVTGSVITPRIIDQPQNMMYIISRVVATGVIAPITYDAVTNTVSIDATRDNTTRPVGAIDPSIFLMPYPESEVIQNPLLSQAPVPYDFTDEKITDLFN